MQQIDAQGPIVVDRISTQFAEVACTPANARQLVEALHGGTAVTLSADGKTATFTPTAKLGYGESYIALALAAEALRNAGVTGCATPDQWKAALMGGPLSAAGTSTTSTSTTSSASSSSSFPGILALRSQGQGWGQIAKTTNVQLGQIVSNAGSSLNLSSSGDTSLSPTGRSATSSSTDTSSKPSTSSDTSNSSSTRDSTLSPTGRDSSAHPGKGDEKGKGKGKMKGHDSDSSTSSSTSPSTTSPSSTSPSSSSSSSSSDTTTPRSNR